ncbi:hypothetical protein GQ53DRAFT_890278 [Thozetella sp. PMI_491]|nr:hypothetical protein GQ53DRAFT_890278 [Thozetella sp. PMI_491]
MAASHKTYFLAPSWSIRPGEVALGSVISNPRTPQKPLSSPSLVQSIDTLVPEEFVETNCSGTAKKDKQWSVELFANVLEAVSIGPEASFTADSTFQVDYSCDTMSTSRFTPSLSYISKAAGDTAVKKYLKDGGFRSKCFVITGIKTVSNVTITTLEEKKHEVTAQIGIEIPVIQTTIGPKGSYSSGRLGTHTRTIEGPIVFAFELEAIRVNLRGRVKHEEYVDGAMLTKKDGPTADYIIERAGQTLDEDDVDEFDLQERTGIDERGDPCDIYVPI